MVSKQQVYLLQHVHEINGTEEVKLIGVFKSRLSASQAKTKLMRKPGFKKHPKGFHIGKHNLDDLNWSEGFITKKWKSDICCKSMGYHLKVKCPVHKNPWACPDKVVIRTKSNKVLIPIHDGGSSGIEIEFCPWCGEKL